MNLSKFLIFAAIAGSVSSVYGASTTVDNYDVPGFSITANGNDLGDVLTAAETTLIGTVTRDVVLTKSGILGATASNTAGFIALSNDGLVTSTLTIGYTLSTANDISGGSAFSFLLLYSDAQVTYDVKVTDASANVSSITGVSTPVLPGVFNVLFSSLSVGADFTQVKNIEFTIHGGSSVDVGIDAFGIDFPGVPEASTYAAVGFMSLVAFGAYRRARK